MAHAWMGHGARARGDYVEQPPGHPQLGVLPVCRQTRALQEEHGGDYPVVRQSVVKVAEGIRLSPRQHGRRKLSGIAS